MFSVFIILCDLMGVLTMATRLSDLYRHMCAVILNSASTNMWHACHSCYKIKVK